MRNIIVIIGLFTLVGCATNPVPAPTPGGPTPVPTPYVDAAWVKAGGALVTGLSAVGCSSLPAPDKVLACTAVGTLDGLLSVNVAQALAALQVGGVINTSNPMLAALWPAIFQTINTLQSTYAVNFTPEQWMTVCGAILQDAANGCQAGLPGCAVPAPVYTPAGPKSAALSPHVVADGSGHA